MNVVALHVRESCDVDDGLGAAQVLTDDVGVPKVAHRPPRTQL
jgi:hypothetical protein